MLPAWGLECESRNKECNSLTTKCSHYIETSQLICIANQWNGFYMMTALVDNGSIHRKACVISKVHSAIPSD